MDVAGLAIPTLRPADKTPGIDTTVATGKDTSGSVVTIGPGSTTPDGYQNRVLAHEFTHVVQFASVPRSFAPPPLSTVEGWAKYQDKRFGNGDVYPVSGPAASGTRGCVAKFFTGALPTDDQIYGKDAGCYYEIASTLYAYAADQGDKPMLVADEGAGKSMDPITASGSLSGAYDTLKGASGSTSAKPELTLSGWSAWVKSNLG